MPTMTATQARSEWFQLLKALASGQEPARILSKHGSAVLMSEEDYESLLETAYLLSIPGLKKSLEEGERQIKKGELVDADEVFKDLQ